MLAEYRPEPPRSIICRNPFDAAEIEDRAWPRGTRIIDVLAAEFPDGFENPTAVFLGDEKIKPADFDLPIPEGEAVHIMQRPGGPLAAPLLVALITTLITTALSIAFTLLFAKKPASPSQEQADAVFSVQGVGNEARVNEPVTVVYGERIVAPDIVAQPYRYYEDNEQYFVMLTCIGSGWHDVAETYIDDTPTADLADANTVQTWAYQPDEHGQAFGVIEADAGIYENCVTSIEVGDQELEKPSAAGDSVTTTIQAIAPNRLVITSAEFFPASFVEGEQVTITGQGANDGTYTILTRLATGKEIRTVETLESTAPGGLIDDFYASAGAIYTYGFEAVLQLQITDYENANTTGLPVGVSEGGTYILEYPSGDQRLVYVFDIGELPGIYTIVCREADTALVTGPAGLYKWRVGTNDPTCTITLGASTVIGPFVSANAGTTARRIEIDIEAPLGFYYSANFGGPIEITSPLEVTIQPIDDDGLPAGAPTVETVEFTAGTLTPQRRTYSFDVADGRYTVSIARQEDGVNNNDRNNSKLVWTALKAVLVDPGTAVYGETTLMAWKIKATNGIANLAQRQARVRVTRELARYGGTLSRAPTQNAADAFWDAISDDEYGADRPTSEIDLASVQSAWDRWDTSSGFNAEFRDETTVWAALEAILQAHVAKPVPLEGSVAILRSEPQPIRRTLFGPENIVRGTLELGFEFDATGAKDGVEITYDDPNTYKPRELVWPADARNPDRITLWGCTNEAMALAFAKYRYARMQKLRQTAQFECSMEGRFLLLEDRIAIRHWLGDWGQGGLLIGEGNGTGALVLKADKRLSWSSTEQNYIMLRNRDGSVTDPLPVSQGDDTDDVVFASVPEGDFPLGESEQPTIFSFGTADTGVADFSLVDIEHMGGKIFKITGVVYDESVFDELNNIIGADT